MGAGRESLNKVTDLEARIAEIEILDTLKGDAVLEYVYSGLTDSTCDFHVEEGDEWLFFTGPTGEVGLCGGHVSRSQVKAAGDNFDALIAGLLAYSTANPEVGSVPFVECQVNGYQVGTSSQSMIEALGEPRPPPPSDPNEVLMDTMSYRYDYGGLTVLFGPSLYESWAFQVRSNEYELRSGIGIGSTEQEVLDYYGPTVPATFDDVTILPYQVVWKDGRKSAVHLDFTVVNGNVTRIDAHPRGKKTSKALDFSAK